MSDHDVAAEERVAAFLAKPRSGKGHHADDDQAAAIETERRAGPPAWAKAGHDTPPGWVRRGDTFEEAT